VQQTQDHVGVSTAGAQQHRPPAGPAGLAGQAEANGAPQGAARRVAVSDSAGGVGYANFCAVQRAAEEVLLDFGISAQRFGQGQPSIQITHRLALSYPTAKRLLDALRMAFERMAAERSGAERIAAEQIVAERPEDSAHPVVSAGQSRE
jgi:hypothetical protein